MSMPVEMIIRVGGLYNIGFTLVRLSQNMLFTYIPFGFVCSYKLTRVLAI